MANHCQGFMSRVQRFTSDLETSVDIFVLGTDLRTVNEVIISINLLKFVKELKMKEKFMKMKRNLRTKQRKDTKLDSNLQNEYSKMEALQYD